MWLPVCSLAFFSLCPHLAGLVFLSVSCFAGGVPLSARTGVGGGSTTPQGTARGVQATWQLATAVPSTGSPVSRPPVMNGRPRGDVAGWHKPSALSRSEVPVARRPACVMSTSPNCDEFPASLRYSPFA